MININLTSTNRWISPTKSLVSIENPYYILEVTSKDTFESSAFLLTDSSSNEVYFDFSLDGSDFSLTQGTYDFSLYESATSSLTLPLDGLKLAVGLLDVTGTPSITTFEPSYDDQTIVFTYDE